MNVGVRVPSRSGSAWKLATLITVKLGSKLARTAGSSSRMNMLRANRLRQASSLITRTLMR